MILLFKTPAGGELERSLIIAGIAQRCSGKNIVNNMKFSTRSAYGPIHV